MWKLWEGDGKRENRRKRGDLKVWRDMECMEENRTQGSPPREGKKEKKENVKKQYGFRSVSFRRGEEGIYGLSSCPWGKGKKGIVCRVRGKKE